MVWRFTGHFWNIHNWLQIHSEKHVNNVFFNLLAQLLPHQTSISLSVKWLLQSCLCCKVSCCASHLESVWFQKINNCTWISVVSIFSKFQFNESSVSSDILLTDINTHKDMDKIGLGQKNKINKKINLMHVNHFFNWRNI